MADDNGNIVGFVGANALHMAFATCKEKPDPQEILQIVQTHPEYLTQINEGGETPLYVAIRNSRRAGILSNFAFNNFQKALCTMLDACPIDILQKPVVDINHLLEDGSSVHQDMAAAGQTPLHLLCSSSINGRYLPDATRVIVEKYPRAVLLQDAKERTPLHLACGPSVTNLSILSFLLEAQPEALRVKDIWQQTPMHYAFMNRHPDPEVLHYLISLHPDGLLDRDERQRTPLHCGVATIFREDVLRDIIGMGSPALMIPDADGRSPLEMAAMSQSCSREFLEFLMEQVSELDKEASPTPLHAACRFAVTIRWPDQIYPALLRSSPADALQLRDGNGNVLLHLACQLGKTGKFLSFIAKNYMGALLAANHNGETPLHIVCKKPMNTLNAVGEQKRLVYSHWPSRENVARPHDSVDDAVWERKHNANSIRLLAKLEPRALQMADWEGSLPLHQACKHGAIEITTTSDEKLSKTMEYIHELHFRAIQTMVTEYRAGMNEKDSAGWTPLQLACIHNAPIQVIHYLVTQDPTVCITGWDQGNSDGG